MAIDRRSFLTAIAVLLFISPKKPAIYRGVGLRTFAGVKLVDFGFGDPLMLHGRECVLPYPQSDYWYGRSRV